MSEPIAALPPIHSPYVELAFELTFDEFKEGLSPRVGRKQQIRAWMIGVRVLIWGTALSLITGVFLVSHAAQNAGFTPPARAVVADLWIALIPSALAASAVLFVILATAMANLLFRKLGIKQKWIGNITSVGIYVAAYIVARFIISTLASGSLPSWRGSMFEATMLSSSPWVALLFFFRFRGALVRKHLVAKQWKASPTYHRHRSVRIDNEGMRVDDGVSRLLYRWPFFKSACRVRMRSRPDRRSGSPHILPKRAFVPEPELQAARSIIGSFIADCRFNLTQRGFPVEPLPVLPIPSANNA